MNRKLATVVSGLVLALLMLSVSWAGVSLEDLQESQKVNGFTARNVYVNGIDKPMGARFISERHGFVVDVMQIQSVPQGFFWVKTPPTSDKGEPHTCEHLLLGKGNYGRYVSTLEDMSLGSSTAYTAQMHTCYHFNTIAGADAFYKILEAKLMAFLHPDFTDEEIRREVCHIGISKDPQTGELFLEEKGTVYTEMVSAFEKPWYYYDEPMSRMIYGNNHPMTYISGGEPSAIRTMTAEDMWKFHRKCYTPANMGLIVAIPDNMPVDDFLKRMDGILSRCWKNPDAREYVGINAYPATETHPAPFGTTKIVTYPSENPQDPGNMYFSWPAYLELDDNQRNLLTVFLDAFASGQTSNLYNLFINSEKRKINIGGSEVWNWLPPYQGSPVQLALEGIDNVHVNETMVDSIRSMIIAELRHVYDYADHSEDLLQFNHEVESRLIGQRKQLEDYLNTPPMFGFRRGSAGGWMSTLRDLEQVDGFRKSMVFKEQFAYAESLLATGTNFWKQVIDDARLLEVLPYAVGHKPDPSMMVQMNEAKQARLAKYLADFKKKYGVSDDLEAIARYKEEFDANTAQLEKLAADQELPGFVDNPPLTLDEQLHYETITLPGDIPLVASTFENMNSATVGLALRLDVVPGSDLVYVPFLTDVMTEIGVVENGVVVPYEDMQARLRKEVLRLNADFDLGYQSGRIELMLTGAGSNLDEFNNALHWMQLALYSPYLSVDNIPRMLDVIDQNLVALRNRMKGSEEGWVTNPSYAYRYQTDPLFLTAGSFLTQTHHYHRLRCLLTDPGDETARNELVWYLRSLGGYGQTKSRKELSAMLSGILDNDQPDPKYSELFAPYLTDLTATAYANVLQAMRLLRASLAEIPDANLADDWAYLCNEMAQDISVTPEQAINDIKRVMGLIRHTDNARLYMVSNSTDRAATMDSIREFVGQLDTGGVSKQTYADVPCITKRLQSRAAGISEPPTYVGLVYDGTNNGVIIVSAKYAEPYDTCAVLDILAGEMYCGGGPHSLFMRTWSAGLAYSNGVSIGASSGRVGYYAERCPDVAETMRFVVSELESAKENPELCSYSVAQIFGDTRAASRYVSRGEAMAADLADGYTPERIATYRKKILETSKDKNLYSKLRERMDDVYGRVLIGYGEPISANPGAYVFLVGPEPQFASLETLVENTEGKQPIYRLYPRDFWLTI
ncbi:MAG: hypothetical protein JW763_11105 [candidate division Zixibacteria bacterium]|nr:hypothetical protein [candidate division Zixibacteria bacterium]